ncbi:MULTISPECIES: GAF and ANTAR domain-containing protein [Catenuloplanes]|uniref:ANTAR domain-containing protein n=1 Tax=Catenuloplanes niger TaxID=587534 RepID=A0AAE4CPY1_9ACTN|nr:GAF and ANTAR domain-containing protein [Catenuloplanes niger]MDR7321146.1 hypothetical protein [Catenuloplanes niger]
MDDHTTSIRGLIALQPAGPGGSAGFLQRVCTAATVALSASGAGISVMTDDGLRGVSAASDQQSADLEELQFVLGEGPCMDAFATRRPVLVPDLADGATARWPMYTPAAREGGVRAVFAFPLQVGAARMGVLDVFRDCAGPLTADELPLALAFADVTVSTLLDRQEDAVIVGTGDDLAEAVEYRAEVFQAQGMVMVQLGVTISEAMARMRAYAYAENRPLSEIARDVVARRLRFDQDHP